VGILDYVLLTVIGVVILITAYRIYEEVTS
jgi:hypothetical protein